MPFDLERSSGTWKIGKHSDNFKETRYLKMSDSLGVPAEALDMLITSEVTVECTVSGNTFTDKSTMLGKTTVNTFTFGEECEETDHTGTKRKVTYTMEGDSMVFVYPNHDGKGLVVRQAMRWTDDKTIRHEYKVGDLEGWAEGQRV
ncbi:fatty acid-binding protein, liver-like [Branchiostoma lanceolatum]|uniref:fatty acid-binding protein, liver-like n=1 Tax=Branchiostoma lanceolatum TaxID=7740 RepID=UPI003455DF57